MRGDLGKSRLQRPLPFPFSLLISILPPLGNCRSILPDLTISQLFSGLPEAQKRGFPCQIGESEDTHLTEQPCA